MLKIIALVAAIISVPFINKEVFDVRNLSEIRREAGNRFREIEEYQSRGQNRLARDSLRALIEYFKNKKDPVSKTAVQLGMFQYASNYKQNAISASEYEIAIEEYENLINKYPETLVAEQIFYFIAQCHISLADLGKRREKNLRSAIDNLEKIEKNREEAKNFPKYKYTDLKPGKYFNIDQGAEKTKNVDLAKSLYTKKDMIREMATDTTQVQGELLSDAVLLIADCYTKLGLGEKARDQYNIIINYFIGSDLVDDAQKRIGDTYVKEGDILIQKSKKEKDDAKKQQLKKEAFERYDMAVETYLKFINVYRQSDLISKVYIDLGAVYFKLDQDKKAYDTFAKAINSIKVIEEQAKVQLDIGNYYYKEKKWDDAIENYAKVIQNYSSTEYAANAQFLLAECYEAKGDTVEALKSYNVVCENFRRSTFYPVSAFKIARHYIKQKNYSQAQSYLRQSISRFPESVVAAETQYQLGLIYMKMAEKEKDSTSANMKYRLAIKEFETVIGNYDQAKEWVEKSVLSIGKCYMELGLKTKARETLNSLTSESAIVEKYAILGFEGTDSAIVKDYEKQLNDLKEEQAKAQIYIEIGRKLKGNELNMVDSAITIFEKAVKLAEDTVTIMTAYGDLADAYMKKGKYAYARTLYKEEILENPRCEELRAIQTSFKIAESYFKEKKFDKAIEGFTEFTSRNSDHTLAAPATFLLAKSYFSAGKFQKAKDVYNKLFANYPESDMIDNAALGYAEALNEQGNHKEAIKYVHDFLKENPGIESSPSLYYKIADIYNKNINNVDSAIFYYEKVLKFSDNFLYSSAAYIAGNLYASKKMDKEAIESYAKVKKEDKEYYRAAQGEIGSIRAKTDPEGAIENYKKIESTSDDVADKVISRMGIGDVYNSQKKYLKAAESYKIIYKDYLAADTNLRAASVVKIIDAYNNASKFKKVIKWCNIMIKEFSKSRYIQNAYYFKANAYYFLKDYRKARNIFAEVMKFDNKELSQISQYQRAECLLSMNRKDAAIREFNAFMKEHPESSMYANALFQVANIYWGRELYTKAKRMYRTILKKYPDFQAKCWVINYLAFCYNKENRWQLAKREYKKVILMKCSKDAKTFAKEQIRAINVQH